MQQKEILEDCTNGILARKEIDSVNRAIDFANRDIARWRNLSADEQEKLHKDLKNNTNRDREEEKTFRDMESNQRVTVMQRELEGLQAQQNALLEKKNAYNDLLKKGSTYDDKIRGQVDRFFGAAETGKSFNEVGGMPEQTQSSMAMTAAKAVGGTVGVVAAAAVPVLPVLAAGGAAVAVGFELYKGLNNANQMRDEMNKLQEEIRYKLNNPGSPRARFAADAQAAPASQQPPSTPPAPPPAPSTTSSPSSAPLSSPPSAPANEQPRAQTQASNTVMQGSDTKQPTIDSAIARADMVQSAQPAQPATFSNTTLDRARGSELQSAPTVQVVPPPIVQSASQPAESQVTQTSPQSKAQEMVAEAQAREEKIQKAQEAEAMKRGQGTSEPTGPAIVRADTIQAAPVEPAPLATTQAQSAPQTATYGGEEKQPYGQGTARADTSAPVAPSIAMPDYSATTPYSAHIAEPVQPVAPPSHTQLIIGDSTTTTIDEKGQQTTRPHDDTQSYGSQSYSTPTVDHAPPPQTQPEPAPQAPASSYTEPAQAPTSSYTEPTQAPAEPIHTPPAEQPASSPLFAGTSDGKPQESLHERVQQQVEQAQVFEQKAQDAQQTMQAIEAAKSGKDNEPTQPKKPSVDRTVEAPTRASSQTSEADKRAQKAAETLANVETGKEAEAARKEAEAAKKKEEEERRRKEQGGNP
jgi:hypothetical protein